MHRFLAGGLAVATAFGLAPVASTSAREQDVREAIVKIYTVHNRPNYYNPWTQYGPRGTTGSGCIIEGNKILTNAHVVSDQTFIQVRRYGTARRLAARLLAVSHEADLALLTVDEPFFFDGVEPLTFGGLPETQQEVLAYGFPLGGDTLSITKGVVSRIEHQTYTHSSCHFLAAQLDAAINPGNSGGPVVVDGSIVGVAMQSISQADNIGYMVPMPIIRHFLADIEDGAYDNFPSMGIILQEMENPALRKRFSVGESDSGVLVIRILPGSPAAGRLEPGDVITAVDGNDVADDGTVEFRPKQRTQISYFVQEKQVGDTIEISYLRGGEPHTESLTLHRSLREDWLIPMERFDQLPTYYIYGGVIFCPVTKNLLREWGNSWYNAAPKEIVAYLGRNYRTEERDELVLVLKVLAADVNEGYHEISNWLVAKVNGTGVRNLRHLITLIEAGANRPFIEIEGNDGQVMVLDALAVADAHPSILELYRIAADRSPDLVSGATTTTGEAPP